MAICIRHLMHVFGACVAHYSEKFRRAFRFAQNVIKVVPRGRPAEHVVNPCTEIGRGEFTSEITSKVPPNSFYSRKSSVMVYNDKLYHYSNVMLPI